MSIEPGLYSDMPEQEYHSLDLCSASQLEELRKSCPAIARYKALNGCKANAAMEKGTAAHVLTLEPEHFSEQVIKAECKDRRSKIYKDITAANPGKVVLPEPVYAEVVQMAFGLWSNSYIASVLNSTSHREASLIWDCSKWVDGDGRENQLAESLPAKTRCDGISFELGLVWDLKTTADASYEGFKRVCHNMGYNRKAAFYLAAMNYFWPNVDWQFAMVALSSKPTFPAALYRVPEAWVDHGRKQLLSSLKTYSDCMDADNWPGYPEKMIDLHPEEWMLRDE